MGVGAGVGAGAGVWSVPEDSYEGGSVVLVSVVAHAENSRSPRIMRQHFVDLNILYFLLMNVSIGSALGQMLISNLHPIAIHTL